MEVTMTNSDISVHAHAKINLYLDVIGKRPDGYHEIETVFHSIGLHDDVIIRKRRDGEITVHFDHPQVPCDERNLAYRAAKVWIDQTPGMGGVEITIQKRIPVAAGLGGGSADAAAVLGGMNQLFDLNLTHENLMRLGAQLGADVPFCLLGGAALGRGIGEVLTPLPPLDAAWLVLANPGFGIPTAWVYQNINLSLTQPQKDVTILVRHLRNGEVLNLATRLYNELETPVFARYPAVAELKTRLAGCPGSYGALMSGSGATVFALMQSESKASRVVSNFKAEFAFCTATTTSRIGLCIS